tara:strand:+ start:95 stop:958 length:864 start_codon:yes stop_codon:yes gene_type:complete
MVERYISSEEASNIIGVNVSTIKRWADRGKLDCLVTAGGHRKFLMRHLASFLKENSKYRSKLNVFPYKSSEQRQLNQLILKRHFPELREILLSKSIDGNREICQHIMNGLYLAGLRLDEIYDDILVPVLSSIGEKWTKGDLAIYEEHVATKVIQGCIHGMYALLNKPKNSIGLALCIGLKEELHEIPLFITEQILLNRGFDVINLGPNTPLERIETLFNETRPDRLYISITFVKDPASAECDLVKLFALANSYNTLVFLGGRGFGCVRLPDNVSYTFLASFNELAEK